MGRNLFDAPMGTPEADAAMGRPGADDDNYLANSPVLHVALSARLGLDPSEMATYRSDMFPSCERPDMPLRAVMLAQFAMNPSLSW